MYLDLFQILCFRRTYLAFNQIYSNLHFNARKKLFFLPYYYQINSDLSWFLYVKRTDIKCNQTFFYLHFNSSEY